MCSSCKKNSKEYPWLIGQNRKRISVCKCCRKHLCDFCSRIHRWKRQWYRRSVYAIKNNIVGGGLEVPHYPSKFYNRPSINNRRL